MLQPVGCYNSRHLPTSEEEKRCLALREAQDEETAVDLETITLRSRKDS